VTGAWSAEVTIGRAEVEHDDRATPAAMAAAVAAAGYAVERVEPRGRALPVL
jgi:hypothetical protein